MGVSALLSYGTSTHNVLYRMSPIPRTRLINEYIVPCYDSSPNSGLTLQEYALIYAILALGEYKLLSGTISRVFIVVCYI